MFESFFPDRNIINPLPYPQGKSGAYTADNPIIKNAYPDSDYPTLMLEYPIEDKSGNILPVGFYEVSLSSDKNFLLLSQSKMLKAKVPVYKYEEIVPDEKELKEKEKKEKKRKKYEEKVKNKMKPEKFDTTKIENKLSQKVTLIDDNRDYYILEFVWYNHRAWGAIPK